MSGEFSIFRQQKHTEHKTQNLSIIIERTGRVVGEEGGGEEGRGGAGKEEEHGTL